MVDYPKDKAVILACLALPKKKALLKILPLRKFLRSEALSSSARYLSYTTKQRRLQVLKCRISKSPN
jgi:hypothetical protein